MEEEEEEAELWVGGGEGRRKAGSTPVVNYEKGWGRDGEKWVWGWTGG